MTRQEYFIWDENVPAFGIRHRLKGNGTYGRTYVYQYRIGDKQRRMTIGRESELTTDQAREIVAQLKAAVRLGADPQGTKQLIRSKRLTLYEAEKDVALIVRAITTLEKEI